ncbi:hypothetical protein CF055_01250 [Clostridium botulinum]|uniref:Uncharacterized protein n=1 Tax=Clostridium botulinum (strain Hall / ATCC 3502 / NCTC 13319 / Type A) TaxID=441771 RepID=A5I3H8_CLOBH|nr:hypothetical protein RSJ15_10350 [Clostridium botulinum]MBN3361497.1 hypothetical protein [Clostridium botulinum]CAL83596.1 hypothetical protein CBO2057 [Clostridium botulinum A str. ATCC 3502]
MTLEYSKFKEFYYFHCLEYKIGFAANIPIFNEYVIKTLVKYEQNHGNCIEYY